MIFRLSKSYRDSRSSPGTDVDAGHGARRRAATAARPGDAPRSGESGATAPHRRPLPAQREERAATAAHDPMPAQRARRAAQQRCTIKGLRAAKRRAHNLGLYVALEQHRCIITSAAKRRPTTRGAGCDNMSH